MEKLAIDGGAPTRKEPFPRRTPYDDADLKEVGEALATQDLFHTANNKVVALEREFAAMYGTKHAMACSSGTAAVHMAVAALDCDPGSEIITAPVTDFGTVAGMLFQGLVPVFADWKPGMLTMDVEDVERRITPRTRGIVVVHLFGNPCDMDAVMEMARRRGLPVIEDCSQAYCTTYKGRLVGTIGDIGTFSMQMSKHLPTGEGGLTITNSDDHAMRMSLFRDKGWENRGKWGPRSYSFLGLNYRMNELTAAVARAQLRKVEQVVCRLNALGTRLTDLLAGVRGVEAAPVTPGGMHSYWLYPFRVTSFDAQRFVAALNAEGIPAGWGYTVDPIYLCTDALRSKRTFGNASYPFNSAYYDGDIEYAPGLCPVAESQLRQIGVLRFCENWTEQDIADVASAFRKVAEGLTPAP
jgi:perosamine synthetase